MSPDINELMKKLEAFRDEREWEQFHDSKNLALALSIEASELNELFLWKDSDSAEKEVDLEKLKDELADVFSYALLLANKHELDVKGIVENKIQKNKNKYPVNKSKGKNTKYTNL